jgi:hypothetical protein
VTSAINLIVLYLRASRSLGYPLPRGFLRSLANNIYPICRVPTILRAGHSGCACGERFPVGGGIHGLYLAFGGLFFLIRGVLENQASVY